MQKSVATYFGAAAAGVVDVIPLQRDEVAGACEVDGPVVVAVAGRGVRGGAVDLIVGDCYAI